MTQEEIAKVEQLVNEAIVSNYEVVTKEMSIADAKKSGAMALFGEKYGEVVRVVDMGGYSIELCGGTHVANTGVISTFKILSESGIAAGVRRIEALTGDAVLQYYKDIAEQFNNAVQAAKCEPAKLTDKIIAMEKELKELQSENQSLKDKIAGESMGNAMDNVIEINGTKFLAVNVPDVDMNALRNLGDQLKQQLGEGVILLASAMGADKVSLVAMATEQAMQAGAHAGNLIKSVAAKVGGGGGGRPNMAQAGGKNPHGIDDAFALAKTVLEEQLSK